MDSRKPQVNEDYVGLLVLNNDQTLLSGNGFKDSIALVFQIGPQNHADCIVVLDNHDRTNHVSIQPFRLDCAGEIFTSKL
jgi:hypothetical protein